MPLAVQIDESMMTELQEVQSAVNPSDTLLVVDAMTGQEAAGLVKAFNDAAPLTGRHRCCLWQTLHQGAVAVRC